MSIKQAAVKVAEIDPLKAFQMVLGEDETMALLPEGADNPIGTPDESEFNVSLVAKIIADVGKLALETSRAIKNADDPNYVLNQVFLPAVVNKLFAIGRRSKNTGLMTNLRKLMGSAAQVAVHDPKTAFDMILNRTAGFDPDYPDAKPGEALYVDFDDDLQYWGIFGDSSGHCYSQHSSEEEAEKALEKMKGQALSNSVKDTLVGAGNIYRTALRAMNQGNYSNMVKALASVVSSIGLAIGNFEDLDAESVLLQKAGQKLMRSKGRVKKTA